MVASVKVFKKTSPNAKLTVYLGKRDFVDHQDHVDPIEGVVVADNDYLKGRKVFCQVKLSLTFIFDIFTKILLDHRLSLPSVTVASRMK